MAIEIDLQPPRRIAAHLDKRLSPLLVIQIEIVVVGDDRFVTSELKHDPLSRQLMRTEGIGFFLSNTDENYGIAHRSLAPHLLSAPIFRLLALKSKKRTAFSLGECFDRC